MSRMQHGSRRNILRHKTPMQKRNTMKCANCHHNIRLVTFERYGEVMKEYRHSDGGVYCKVGDLGGCLCNHAERETQ